MEFSTRFARGVISVFDSSDHNNPIQLERELSLDSNNVFRRSLIIEVNDKIEIPVIAREHFEDLVLEKIN